MSSARADDVSRITRGAGWMLPATLVGQGGLFLLDIYTNGLLDIADYGLFNAVKRVLQLLTFVVLLGMENAVIRAVATAASPAEARGAVRLALAVTGGVSLLVAGALMLAAPAVAAWVDPSPGTAVVLAIGAATLPFAAARTIAVSASQGWSELRHRAIVMFLVWPAAQFVGMALLVQALGLGAIGAMLSYLAAMGIGAALAGGLVLRLRPDLRTRGEGRLAPLLVVAWPLWIQGIIMAVYTWADQVLLAGLRSTELAGVYGPVATLSPLFGVGLGALSGAFAPVIAQKHKEGDHAGLAAMYRLVTRWAMVLTLPPVVVCLAAPEAVLGLWPHGSVEAVPALRIVCAAQLFGTAVGAVNYLLIMAGRSRAVLVNGIPAMITSLALSLWLIPRYGVTGAGIAAAGAAVVANGVGLAQVWALLRLHPFDRAFLRPLVAAVPAFGVAWLARGLPPLLAVGLGGGGAGLTFLAVLRLLGLDAGDRQVIDTFARKLRR